MRDSHNAPGAAIIVPSQRPGEQTVGAVPRGWGTTAAGPGVTLHVVDLPNHAPTWAAPLIGALLDAGFVADGETRGGMAGYSLSLRHGDCRVTLGGDRGEFDAWLAFPNPRRGRGHPRLVDMPAEDYVAAERGDTDATFLMSDSAGRTEAVAEWLSLRAGGSAALTLDDALLQRIRALQRLRAQALFGGR